MLLSSFSNEELMAIYAVGFVIACFVAPYLLQLKIFNVDMKNDSDVYFATGILVIFWPFIIPVFMFTCFILLVGFTIMGIGRVVNKVFS